MKNCEECFHYRVCNGDRQFGLGDCEDFVPDNQVVLAPQFVETIKEEYALFDEYDEISLGTLRKDLDRILKEVTE